ncbi:Coiled-coil domain-containing protein [Phytophthora cinnamomi]|uniref:Coiled-coil domain-containing protein n=1 Tax=Phytophthora cinnamomi TaxID=4785 RepID=UPI00355A980F|nr:Coiled-coil domain-containing protein [Phytophthora cinnamomi]
MNDEDELDDLEAKLDDLTHQNDVLRQENELLESYLQRNGQPTTGSDDEEKQSERDKKTGLGSRQRRVRAQVMLTIEQKNDICSTELEAAQKELEETKRSSERLIDTLRAVLEETDIRIAELKKDAYEFKRDIVVGAENFRTGKTIAEKMIRYMEEKLRQKDAIVEKLRLKNATLKSQAQKIDAQLRHKEEMGDALHYIDFHQLQIENKQYVAKIEERNEELLRLKQTTGSTVQVLNNLKKRLHELLEESAWLQGEIRTRTELNEKIVEEIALVEEKNQKDMRRLQSLQIQQSAEPSKDMPQILDYVGQKAKMYELQQEVKNYERKVEIAERAVKLSRAKEAKRLQAQG